MKNIAFQTLITLTLVLLFSCNKDVSEKSTSEHPLTLKNSIENYLIFPDEKSFFDAIDLVGVVENNMLLSIALKSGVKSYAAYYEEFLNRANDENLSEIEYQNLLKEYADIITITDDVVRPRIENPLIWHIINRNGLVKVEDVLSLYTESEKISSLSGNLNALLGALETSATSEDIIRYRYLVDDNFTKAACGYYQSATMTVGDRRGVLTCNLIVEITQSFQYCQTENTWMWNIKSFAVSHGVPYKKNIWNNWVNYKTNNRLDLNYKATTFGNFGFPYGYPIEVIVQYNHVDGFDAISKTHKKLIVEGVSCPSEHGNYQAYYNRMNPNRYSHRGLDHTNWASISCD